RRRRRIVGEDLAPVRVERLPVAGRKDRHLVGGRLTLVLEERVEVGLDHVAQDRCHYPKPRMNFASSDILSGVHGGSHVSSVSTSSTPVIERTVSSTDCWISGPAGQPIEVRL